MFCSEYSAICDWRLCIEDRSERVFFGIAKGFISDSTAVFGVLPLFYLVCCLSESESSMIFFHTLRGSCMYRCTIMISPRYELRECKEQGIVPKEPHYHHYHQHHQHPQRGARCTSDDAWCRSSLPVHANLHLRSFMFWSSVSG